MAVQQMVLSLLDINVIEATLRESTLIDDRGQVWTYTKETRESIAARIRDFLASYNVTCTTGTAVDGT